jgi:hypothetical protein
MVRAQQCGAYRPACTGTPLNWLPPVITEEHMLPDSELNGFDYLSARHLDP